MVSQPPVGQWLRSVAGQPAGDAAGPAAGCQAVTARQDSAGYAGRARAAAPAAAGIGHAPGARRRDTSDGIAKQHNVDAYTLINVNKLAPPFDLTEGQRLVVPRPGTIVASRPPVTPDPASSGEAAREAPKQPAAREPEPSPRAAASRAKPPQSAGGFIWPVDGRIVSEFGAKGGGRFNDGINIAAPAGTPVRAAEAGIVAYAGNELRGFGNMLLIKHAGGWVTAYAHNQELLVRPRRPRRPRPGDRAGRIDGRRRSAATALRAAQGQEGRRPAGLPASAECLGGDGRDSG